MKTRFENYVIEGVRGNFTVSEVKTIQEGDNKGKETLCNNRYFPKLYQCLYYLVGCKVCEYEELAPSQLVDAIHEESMKILATARNIESGLGLAPAEPASVELPLERKEEGLTLADLLG